MPPAPRNPELARQRCDTILRAVISHFARNGFARTDLDAVAAEIGCAKGTLYRYFPSKAELFHEAADFAMRELNAAVRPAEGVDPLEQVKGGIRAYLAFFDAHPEYIELIVQERAEFKDRELPTYFRYRDESRAEWKRVLERLMEDGRLRRISPERVQDVIGNVLYGTIFTNHFAGRKRSLAEQADDVIDVLLRGLLADTGELPGGGSDEEASQS